MGDISELRGLIVIGTFITVTALLIGFLAQSGFIITDYEGREVTAPDYFESISLENYATTWNHTLNGTGASYHADGSYLITTDIGGHTFDFWYPDANVSSLTWILQIHHVQKWWIIVTETHSMTFFGAGTDYGVDLGKTEMDTLYNSSVSMVFQAECTHTQFDVFFAFNETTYTTPTDALNHDELHIMVGITWDRVNTSLNAWDIIGMVLFFQLPNVHIVINAIIAVPIWIGVAYLSFILILRAIGAIFGGGA